MTLPIGLQLYTVRDDLARDVDATLAQIAEMGYQYVELAGLYDKSPEQFRALLDKHSLTAIASHEAVDDPKVAAERAQVLGHKFIVCPYLNESQRKSYVAIAKRLTEAAAKLSEQGLTVCYHNHDFEWQPADGGRRGIDILFDTPEYKALNSELDVYWAAKAGDNPVDWINKLTGRLPLLHMKDMADSPEKGFAEVGTGVLDFKAMIAAARSAGVKYYIVEQDSNWKVSPLESAKVGLENLKKMLG